MTDPEFSQLAASILEELSGAVHRVDPRQVGGLEQAIRSAGAVFLAGAGRSGLVARSFAMRLRHLGLRAYVVGETITPPVGPGDLLLCISRSGDTPSTVAFAEAAASHGARVAAITAAPRSPLSTHSHLTVIIPDLGRPSVQYGGSLFEQAALVVLDALCLQLQHRLGETGERMDQRHANVE